MLSETAAYAEVDVESGCLMKAGGLWEEYFSDKGCQRESFSKIVECGILQNAIPENREEYRSYLDIENMKNSIGKEIIPGNIVFRAWKIIHCAGWN